MKLGHIWISDNYVGVTQKIKPEQHSPSSQCCDSIPSRMTVCPKARFVSSPPLYLFTFFALFFNSQERISSKEKPCLQPPNQYVFVSNQKGLTYPLKKSVARLDQLCISNSQWTVRCCNTYILTIGESATYVVTIIRPAALFRETSEKTGVVFLHQLWEQESTWGGHFAWFFF